MTVDAHSELVGFAQKAQVLALVWLDADPVTSVVEVMDFLRGIPRFDRGDERVVVAMIVGRIANAFVSSERPRELSLHARQRRAHIRDVHTARALECIRREFANPALDLQRVAQQCHLSATYLSSLITMNTHHGFRAHLSVVRTLHAAHLLATTALSIAEVADKTGFKSTTVLDHSFRKHLGLTPSQFRRWG